VDKNLPVGDNEYKVVEGNSWNDENYPVTNQHIILAESADVTWVVNDSANIVINTMPVVAGNFFEAMGLGNNWDPSNLAGEMTDNDGDYVCNIEFVVPAGG
jgi:hypothetical protein